MEIVEPVQTQTIRRGFPWKNLFIFVMAIILGLLVWIFRESLLTMSEKGTLMLGTALTVAGIASLFKEKNWKFLVLGAIALIYFVLAIAAFYKS